VQGTLSSRAIEIIVKFTPQPVGIEIAAEGAVRLCGEPWQGVGMYLSASEAECVRAAVASDAS
jgi:ribose 5-phosphate isomerase RpiB